MEFIVSKREFLKGLSRVQNVADRKSAMPILTNVLVTAETGGVLRLAATDLLVSVAGTVHADVRKPGSAALPARSLFEMVKALPEGDVTVSVGPNLSAKVSSGRRKFEIVGMAGDDFPALPQAGRADLREFPVDLVADLIALTSFSMSTDENRPHLAGTLVENDDSSLRMVTTDGHRLSKAEKALANPGRGPMSLLIPAKGVHELRRLLDEARNEQKDKKGGDHGQGPTVLIGQSGANVFIQREGITMAVKLVDGAFPQYQQVIPKDGDRKARMSRGALLEALRAVSLVSSDRTSGVKLQFSGGKVTISSENPEVGAGTDEIEAELKGRELTIGFNARYVIDALNALSVEDVVLEMSGELDPGVIRPAENHDFIGVIMPMRI